MSDSYSDLHSFYSAFQKAYESVMSNNGLAYKDWSLKSGLVFGLRVDQTTPSNYVNPLILYNESFHNPFSDSRFKTAGSNFSGSGKSTPQSSSVVDIHHNSVENSNPLPNNHNLVGPFSAPAVPVSITNPQLNSKQRQRNTSPAGNALYFKASASGAGESLAINRDKALAQSDKLKAAKLAWSRSEKRKASQRAYRSSEKGKATRRAYAQSERGKAVRKAYRSSEKGKAAKRAWEKTRKMKARQQSEKGDADCNSLLGGCLLNSSCY